MTGSHPKVVFGLKLKHLRLKKELSLKELSAAVGLSPSYINEIERGKKHPKPEKIERFAEVLGVSYDDLVSSKFDRSQVHYSTLLNSPALKKIPFHLFGITLEDIVALIPEAKNEGQALVKALIEVARGYDLRVENFFHIALRCYQEMHKNFFPEIEDAVSQYRARQKWKSTDHVSLNDLVEVLRRDFGVVVDEEALDRTTHLRHVRSALVQQHGRELLFIHKQFNEVQKSFLVLREIGYRALGIEDRGRCSPDIEDQSFDRIKNSFLASYFASAFLIDAKTLAHDMERFFQKKVWEPESFLQVVQSYPATVEMFFYRLSEVLPEYLGLDDLHFLRFDRNASAEVFLVKQLNMSSVLLPTGLGLHEHFCRRWMSVKVLDRLSRSSAQYEVGAQHSVSIENNQEYFCISVARSLQPENENLSSVTIGFRYDKKLRDVIQFLGSPDIENDVIGGTCERCHLLPDECFERAAPQTVHSADRLREQQRLELESLLKK